MGGERPVGVHRSQTLNRTLPCIGDGAIDQAEERAPLVSAIARGEQPGDSAATVEGENPLLPHPTTPPERRSVSNKKWRRAWTCFQVPEGGHTPPALPGIRIGYDVRTTRTNESGEVLQLRRSSDGIREAHQSA